MTPTAQQGSLREQLAAYFLSAPPLGALSAAQRQTYMSRLQQLGALEDDEVRQAAGAHRPLVWGNPVPLLQSLLTAAQQLAAGRGQPILVFPAKEAAIDFHTLLHPRLLSIAMMDLLRLACTAAPKQPVWVRLREQEACLTVSVTAQVSLEDCPRHTLAVIQESAKLHGGSLALSDNVIVFSCGRVSRPPADARPYRSPTAKELLQDSLSAVWTGFYCWLPSSDPPATTSSSTEDSSSDASVSQGTVSSDASPSSGATNSSSTDDTSTI